MNIVCLALIHNHNTERNTYIRPRLMELQIFLTKSQFETQSFEIAYQPEIEPHGLSMAFLRDIIYQTLNRGWRRYRYIKTSLLLRHIFSLLRSAIRRKRYAKGRAWRCSSAIETTVTDKHIRAWAAFLDTDADFLICFEDDAVSKDDSNQRLGNLLDRLVNEKLDHSVYVDLAGGCSLEALRIEKLQIGQDNAFRYYSKPVINTACAYLMNRPLIATFYKLLTHKPWLRMIGIDWMMNALLIQMKTASSCVCMHADPTIFKHGSTTGEYKPWIR